MIFDSKLKDYKSEELIIRNRVLVSIFFVLFLAMILIARLFYLQIFLHDDLATLSEDNRIHLQSLPPPRGLIYDRQGQLIAENLPSFTLTVTKERLKSSI